MILIYSFILHLSPQNTSGKRGSKMMEKAPKIGKKISPNGGKNKDDTLLLFKGENKNKYI